MKANANSLTRTAALVIPLLTSFLPAKEFTAEQIADRTVERRAVEAVLWSMPAVNFDLMRQAFVDLGGKPNQVIYWSRPVDWHNQTLTPNPDTIYFTPFYDTRSGPVVLEIPPAEEGATITGSIDDGWQTAVEDVGPAGADQGRGGKYLILPPDFKGTVPDGYIVRNSATYQGYALLRSNLKSTADVDISTAVAYGRRLRLYPLSAAGNPPATTFVDALGLPYDCTIPYGPKFFEALDRFVQVEPWLTRDKAHIQTLKSIGIEKGKPFAPDAKTAALLASAIGEARAVIESQLEAVFVPPFNPGHHWALPGSPELVEAISTNYANPNSYPTDARALTYSLAYFSAKHLGAGQFYLMTIKDSSGNRLLGDKSYRLTIPANAPVKLYWSATAYNGATHALIKNVPRASRGSNSHDLQKNADGTVDLWFAAQAPAGKESNWVPIDAKGHFEVLLRFYGPEEPLFKKTWVLPDIEELK